jgi:hypothetical protein
MASGTAPALDPKGDSQTETKETCTTHPLTLKQRVQRLFRDIFEGREDHLGWHQ